MAELPTAALGGPTESPQVRPLPVIPTEIPQTKRNSAAYPARLLRWLQWRLTSGNGSELGSGKGSRSWLQDAIERLKSGRSAVRPRP